MVIATGGVDLSVGAIMFIGAGLAGKMALAGQPLPLVASCWQDGVLSLRLAGAEAQGGGNGGRQRHDKTQDDHARLHAPPNGFTP